MVANCGARGKDLCRVEDALAVQQTSVATFIDPHNLAEEQLQYPLLRNISSHITGGYLPEDSREAKQIRDLSHDSEVDLDGVLWHVGGDAKLLWLPQQLRSEILHLGHDHPLSGHMGYFKTYKRIRQHHFWLGMRADVSRYVRACGVCQRMKSNRQKPKGMMTSSWATVPMDELSVDIIGPLPPT
ncbi:protein NYNRIN-like [Ornithodoros turicata]|uniref:protein NYNRIN-like n=1 Tax=Ornithodoros turicata TaxID=34597 RepID=UPI003139EB81